MSFGISWPAAIGKAVAIKTAAPRIFVRFFSTDTSGLSLVEHAVVVCRFTARLRFHVHALQIRRDGNPRAGIADEFPSDEILIAAVKRIGEGALDRVRAQQIEERRGP